MHDEETISSWICRSIQFGNIGVGGLVPQAVKDMLVCKNSSGDFDYGYNSQEIKVLGAWHPSAAIKLAHSLKTKPSAGLLPPDQRVQFCSACITEDLRNWRTPIWRNSWSDMYCAICETHLETFQSLIGDYSCRDVFHRASQASRWVIDSMSFHTINVQTTSENSLLFSDPSVTDMTSIQKIRTQLEKLCLIVQRDISSRLINSDMNGDHQLLAIGDIYHVLLRRHRRGIDPWPYCLQIADKLKKVHFVATGKNVVSIESLLSGCNERQDPHVRMVALGCLAVIFGYPEAEEIWYEIAKLFLAIGVLMPHSASGLFGILTGDQAQGNRDWIMRRAVLNYSSELTMRLAALASHHHNFNRQLD